MKRIVFTCVAALALALGVNVVAQQPYRTWSAYGGDVEQLRYSSLRQITRANVSRLQVAWTYDTHETGGLQTQPLIVDGVLYAYTPTHKTIALDAATGRLLWTFDSGIAGRGPNRGLMFWSRGRERRVFAAVDNFLYALDAKTGVVIPSFGEQGRIDLRADLGRPIEGQSVRLTSPGVVYKDLVIVGGRVSEGLPASPGDVRAYDARTGALRWSFHTIPHPGESGYDTWSTNSWQANGAANSWPGMALDERRGIVYVPTGSAAADFYGGDRLGDNLFANCLIALDAATGKHLWHFQVVRHDIWDRDLPSPPVLLTVRRNGRTIDAVAQTTKHGFIFVLDRVTGKPLFPVETRAFPKSDVPGEVAADSQVIPLAPKPFARQRLTEDDLTVRTPEARRWALEKFRTFRSDGLFVPLTVGQDTVVFPGFDGGAEWGGAAADPETGLLYVNANDLAWTGALAPTNAGQTARAVYLRDCASCHRDDRQGTPPSIPSLVGIGDRKTTDQIATMIRQGGGRMPAVTTLDRTAVNAVVKYLMTGEDGPAGPASNTPNAQPYRFTGYQKFLDPDGYPAVAPPWGTLSAVNLNTGEYAWRIPLGEYPELAANGMTNTGTENYGGPIVTAGGLVFIGATNYDQKFHAFDKTTGKLLWEATLPFSGNATPATYEVSGRQFVVIAAGGGYDRRRASGGVYVAFALPK
jgi:quinoprotein glucose dehydrogenase